MQFLPTEIEGVYVIEPEKISDERGFFARSYCHNEFLERGLEFSFVQSNLARSLHAGTIRGLHYQISPAEESKLVRCTYGSIYDVIVDLRQGSRTYGKHLGVTLSRENGLSLYVPRQFAHGYQTLLPETEVHYQVTAYHNADSERGLRYNDSTLSINWPLCVTLISKKDTLWADFQP